MQVIAEIFHRILTPLYGNQSKAIGQIRESTDRKAYLLYDNKRPVGVLVYKTIPSEEFSEYGVNNSVEIKSLFVDHAIENSGRGLGSSLVDKLKEEVANLPCAPDGVHVTVSETKEESMIFFKKKGFEVKHAWKDRYIRGTTEYLLFCPTKIAEFNQNQTGCEYKFNALNLDKNEGEEHIPELFHVIHNAHFDDIHSLKRLSDGTFISGSKDNSLQKWNQKGELVNTIYDVEPTLQSERNWITAVEVINDEYWVSGERNGRIFLWKTNGEYVKEIKLKLPKPGHICQPLNTQRVLCFAPGLNPDKPSMFVGLPKMFNQYNFIETRTESCASVHKNDWVYCIHPISQNKVLAAVGCTIKSFDRLNNGWSDGDIVLPEAPAIKGKPGSKPLYQRQFISSIIPLKSSENLYGVSFFGGSVKVLDVESRTIIQTWQEHTGRIWALENLHPQVFASSGEDKVIKIWDIRLKNSAHTIQGHVGQVTAMLKLNENTLLAATCPDDALTNNKRAEIRFYDYRVGHAS